VGARADLLLTSTRTSTPIAVQPAARLRSGDPAVVEPGTPPGGPTSRSRSWPERPSDRDAGDDCCWANSQARRCRMLAISRRALSGKALVRAWPSPRRQRSGRVPTLGIRAKHARRWERRPCSVMGYSASALAPEHSKWGRAQCRQRSPDLSGITPAAIDRASPTDGLPYATCVAQSAHWGTARCCAERLVHTQRKVRNVPAIARVPKPAPRASRL
jgi:hypothetical protein